MDVKGEEKENHVISAIKMPNYHNCTLYNYYTENFSKTCSEAVWGDLGIEPLNLRRNKRKVVWFLRLLKKGKDSFCKKVFEKEWNKCKIPGRKRKQWKKCVLDIISDMDLTSTSLGSKEAVSSINNAFKNFVITYK